METNPRETRNRKRPFTLSGRPAYRRRSVRAFYKAMLLVTLRRLVRGALVQGWTWKFEVASRFSRDQLRYAFSLPTIAESREYIDSLVFHMPALERVEVDPPQEPPVRGRWFTPREDVRPRFLLFLHGGGYAFYAKAHAGLIALVAMAARARTFALDYRLAPEHPFPAQLEDSLAAYRWLLAGGIDPRRLVIAGDSAGGNLVLATLLALRDAGLPQPALAIGICPWTDIGARGASFQANGRYDWIESAGAVQFGKMFRGARSETDPMLSPVYADLRGLAPTYLQAGGREILYDMIRDFEKAAREQGANVTLDVWETMTHDFQAYGDLVPESREALARIGEAVERAVA